VARGVVALGEQHLDGHHGQRPPRLLAVVHPLLRSSSASSAHLAGLYILLARSKSSSPSLSSVWLRMDWKLRDRRNGRGDDDDDATGTSSDNN
jgi:hypothetical protein